MQVCASWGLTLLRILLAHNFYGSSAPSGENKVFEAELALLRDRGHDVETFVRHSDEIRSQGNWGVVKGALSTPWNPWAASSLMRAVARFRPNVVHVHNSFPLISPSVFHYIGSKSAKVMTLHNYRIFCSAGIPMREGKVCTECLDARSMIPAVRYGCYRGSRVATLPMAVSVGMHRALGTWTHKVDGFIALSNFQRQRLVQAGLPPHKVHVKPNFYPGSPSVFPWLDRGHYVIFAGRLTAEKGVLNLLKAWRNWGVGAPELRIVGEGPMRAELELLADGLPVRFLGQLQASEAEEQIAGAKLLVLPSECFEGFPMVVRESFAFGTPVAVSDLGPLPSIVTDGVNGLVFPVANPQMLFNKVRQAWETPGLLARLGEGARIEFEAKYNEDANYEILMQIYCDSIAMSKQVCL